MLQMRGSIEESALVRQERNGHIMLGGQGIVFMALRSIELNRALIIGQTEICPFSLGCFYDVMGSAYLRVQ